MRLAHFLASSALLLLVLGAGGDGCRPEGTLYRLTPDTTWLEGCIFGPCRCPVAQFDDLSGSFRLVELPTLQPGPTRLFEVRQLRWRMRRGEEKLIIRGTGTYSTAAPVLDEQRLILDLEVDGDPIERLDSGLVKGGLAFPFIDIDARTPGLCFQTALQLRAVPAAPAGLLCPDPADPGVHYVADSNLDPSVCALIRFACEPGQELFSNACGCGCIEPTSAVP